MSFVTNKSLKVALEGVKSELDNSLPTKVSQLENDSQYITETDTYSREQIGWLLSAVNDEIETKVTKDELEEINTSINNIKEDLYGSQEMDTGNAVLVNKTTLEKISVKPDDLNNYDPEEWEPIGVVAIPTLHNVYGTGECGIMALMSASRTTPDTGQTTNQKIMFSGYNIDYPELNNFNEYPSYGTYNEWTQVQLITTRPFLPSDQNLFGKNLLNPNGEQSSWYYLQDQNHHAPSPYNENGLRNLDYYVGTNNVLSDFAGKSNTEFLCSKATSQENWQTDNTIMSSQRSGFFPAACCCWRYHTIGTNQGDWYLPAFGELGYCCVRYKLINKTITDLQIWSGNTYCLLVTLTYFQSSSKYNSNNINSIQFKNGSIEISSYYSENNVRPFLRLNLSKESKYYTKQETDELISNIDTSNLVTKKDIKEKVFTIRNITINNDNALFLDTIEKNKTLILQTIKDDLKNDNNLIFTKTIYNATEFYDSIILRFCNKGDRGSINWYEFKLEFCQYMTSDYRFYDSLRNCILINDTENKLEVFETKVGESVITNEELDEILV